MVLNWGKIRRGGGGGGSSSTAQFAAIETRTRSQSDLIKPATEKERKRLSMRIFGGREAERAAATTAADTITPTMALTRSASDQAVISRSMSAPARPSDLDQDEADLHKRTWFLRSAERPGCDDGLGRITSARRDLIFTSSAPDSLEVFQTRGLGIETGHARVDSPMTFGPIEHDLIQTDEARRMSLTTTSTPGSSAPSSPSSESVLPWMSTPSSIQSMRLTSAPHQEKPLKFSSLLPGDLEHYPVLLQRDYASPSPHPLFDHLPITHHPPREKPGRIDSRWLELCERTLSPLDTLAVLGRGTAQVQLKQMEDHLLEPRPRPVTVAIV